ncbi:MAG: hypothetical protein LBD97_06980 [Bifidobacteriaceae bacterium]|nr:hypothetical protein [Bifidobacteriaceae bacterium]
MTPPGLHEDHPPLICLADANVLYSRSLRDYLLYAMRARLILVRWSAANIVGWLAAARPAPDQRPLGGLTRAGRGR